MASYRVNFTLTFTFTSIFRRIKYVLCIPDKLLLIIILPLALQPTVGFGLSNNVLQFFLICHQFSPSSHSQHWKISIYFLFPTFPGSSPSSRPYQFIPDNQGTNTDILEVHDLCLFLHIIRGLSIFPVEYPENRPIFRLTVPLFISSSSVITTHFTTWLHRSALLSSLTLFVRRCSREPSCDGRHGCDAEHNTTEGAHVRDGAVWGWHRWGRPALWVSSDTRCAFLEPHVVSQVIHS